MDAKRQRIEQMKQMARFEKKMKRELTDVIPSIYACIAYALYERGINADEIEEIFMRTQQLWTESNDNCESMIQWVAEETGIELRSDEWI